MENRDLGEPLGKKIDKDPNAGPNFSYPFDNPQFGARSYELNGETIYEVEIPFSLDEYYQVSEEEYYEHINKWQDIRQRQQEEQLARQKKHEQLRDLGYTSELGIGANDAYQDQLLKVMDEKELTHINQIPKHIEQEKDTSIAIFQTLATQNKSPDFYTQEIIKHLEDFEHQIETEFIDERQFVWLSSFFSNGYIKDVSLFHRFEELKKQNVINHCKRLIHYGSNEIELGYNKYGSRVTKKGYNDIESTELSEGDLEDIIVYLRIKHIKFSEIETVNQLLIDKIKNGFKSNRKKKLLGEYTSISGAYSLTDRYQYKINEIVEIDKATRVSRCEEAKKELIIEDTNKKIQIDLDNFSIEKKSNLGELFKNFNYIIASAEEEIKIKICEEQSSIIKEYIKMLIEKIINKEKLNKVGSHRNTFMLKYEYCIDKISNQIDILQQQLETIAPEKANETGRTQNREQYIAEYKTYFRESFTEKRLHQAYDGDLNDTEAIKNKAIQDIKDTFYKSMLKMGEKQEENKQQYGIIGKDTSGSRGNIAAMKKLKAAFLTTGHSVLLKKLYPDNNQRRSLRQEYTQIITKDILESINTHLSSKESFVLKEYYIRRQIHHVYKKYGGQENLLNNEKEIDGILNEIIEESFLPNGTKLIDQAKNRTNDQANISPKALYEPIGSFFRFIYYHLIHFLKENGLKDNMGNGEIKPEDIENKNKIRQNIIPESMIDDMTSYKQEIDIIHDTFGPEIFNTFVSLYQQIEPIQKEILDLILQKRFFQNAQAGGKLQRITIDTLFSNQTNTDEKEVLDFLEETLQEIVINDLKGSTYEINLLSRDEKKIRTYVNEYIQQFKKQQGIENGNNSTSKYLTK